MMVEEVKTLPVEICLQSLQSAKALMLRLSATALRLQTLRRLAKAWARLLLVVNIPSEILQQLENLGLHMYLWRGLSHVKAVHTC